MTEIDTSAFYLVGTEVDGIDQEYGVTLTNSPFLNIAAGNFYPSSQTSIVDSAVNSIADRQPTVVEKEAIGIPSSPILLSALITILSSTPLIIVGLVKRSNELPIPE